MSEKTFKIVGNDMSDGYHTFDELYDHRCLLFINWMVSDGAPGPVFVVHDHFKGWDLIFCNSHKGQISYHIPIKFRQLYKTLSVVTGNPDFDGHSPQDVLTRLEALAK